MRDRVQRSSQRVLGDLVKLRDLHVRHIEPFADLVEQVRRAVLRQHVGDKQPRGVKPFAQGIFKLETVQPPNRGPPGLGHTITIRLAKRCRERIEKRGHFIRLRAPLFLRRHLAGFHFVVNKHPLFERLRLAKLEAKQLQIQVSLLRFAVVAVETVIFQKRLHRPRLAPKARTGEQRKNQKMQS